ncbi:MULTISPECIES: ATP-dependent helicase HrpB [Pacificibacter]|uniref:ATP-dependent helicase HrpB n=1 Tax=Pacificibacter TaxID=1042323 RepID=UPI001C0850DF|nr:MULTISPECIES: ATP-dependent helicase HrpB [Pacificibacter]MBU2935939.1 ATP-dependent helicase HrpB [Pacificibacter marinus]MDO6614434.1 ATP-dependent helicase HrpB [Pacificibacter sp. 1_MG-2023]
MTRTTLPIDAVLPELVEAVQTQGQAVLMAPPGAGKTTRVPLALLPVVSGKIIMLEPRRLAARSAAERMAETLGEPVGQTVGYRMRGENKTNKNTRIEVVTEGILTRMLQSDPELTGVGAVIFDEFHERSLNADLGLALIVEVRGALRDDLALVVMSATLDAGPVADLLGGAPIVTSEGRAFPVETLWLNKPVPKTTRFEAALADLVIEAVSTQDGSALVFLPGEGEIRRVEQHLTGRVPKDCAIRPLFGAMKFDAQRAAIAPCTTGRKIVLATSIAETSLTIEDVRIVVDGGRSRRARFDPSSGMSRLVTERASKAEAEQRKGRAGRVSEGICYRLWTRGEEGAMPMFAPAEIEAADLSGLAMELALWGASEADLAFLTPPPQGQLAEARALLHGLGALDATHRITAHGRKIAAFPLHPRLAHMLQKAGQRAANLAAILNERDPLRGVGVDLALRLSALSNRDARADRGTVERIKLEAKRLRAGLPSGPEMSLGEMAALAYPDRIGLRRKGDQARYIMSGGKGAVMDDGDALAATRLVVITDTDGAPREAKIRQAVALTDSELRGLYGGQIAWQDVCHWDKRAGRVVARQREMFGALTLDDRPWKDAPSAAIALGALDGMRQIGLPWTAAARRFAARVALMGDGYPDMSEQTLLDTLEDWLLPHLKGAKTEGELRGFDTTEALRAMLDWSQMNRLDTEVPGAFTSPMGRKLPIDYSGEHPEITARIQEMFGTTRHPTVGPRHVPLKVVLTSPAHRPIQVTIDIPNFWKTSYADVRKDMRGQYPRHPWPEDPTVADPTLRAKRRGT